MPETVEIEIAAGLEPLIPGYLENRRADLKRICDALEAGDLDSIALVGHRLKGNGSSYGFDPITSIGEALERAAKTRDSAAAAAARDAYSNFLEAVRVVFR